MYLVEGVTGLDQSDLIQEFGEPMGGGAPQPMGGSVAGTGDVEFEDIKRYVLFGRLKDIKLKLEMANIDRKDPDILNLFEFIDLALLFYNTFTYDQIRTLINTIIDMASSILKIKVEKEDVKAEPPQDPDKLAAMQAQQQAAAEQQPQGQQDPEQAQQAQAQG